MNTSLLSDITTRLASISESNALDSSVLLAHILDKPRTWVLAHPELTLTTKQQKQLEDSLMRLENGEPLPYILGHWEFFSLDFMVTPDVLIPRPETELLVEKAIAWLKQNQGKRSVADVGTGCGAIAVSIAINVPDAQILATDISSKALQIAIQNAEKLGVRTNIEGVECDLLPDSSTIDLLCANLPYIPSHTLQELKIFGHEPTIALDGGGDGFNFIRKLMKTARKHLAPDALMLFEIEESLGKQALKLAHDTLPSANIQLHKDLAGRDRLLEIELP